MKVLFRSISPPYSAACFALASLTCLSGRKVNRPPHYLIKVYRKSVEDELCLKRRKRRPPAVNETQSQYHARNLHRILGMHTFAIVVAYGLYLLLIAGAIWLAILAVFWLPDRLLGFRRAEAVVVVPCATIALWLLLYYAAIPIPGILIISPHKLLAGLALICGLAWCFVEDNWLDR